MSAEMLRRAAALMRERAEAATPGPWMTGVEQGEAYLVEALLADQGNGQPGYRIIARVPHRQRDRNHIASWHPAVALAVADLLDGWADDVESFGGHHKSDDRALTVARTYLGEQP